MVDEQSPGPEWGAAPEIAVFGEWNTANLGDRAIGRSAQAFFAECGWRMAPYALGSLQPVSEASIGSASRAHGPERRRVALRALKRPLRALRQHYRMLRLLPQLAQADAIAVGGGALLSDENLHFPQSLARVAALARALDKPLFCLGCGVVGPWSDRGELLVRRFVSACRLVAPRDLHTVQRLHALCEAMPLPLFGDFCLTESHLDAVPYHARRGVALNVCRVPPDAQLAQERYEDAVVSFARSVAEGGARVCVFTTGTAEDTEPACRVHARLAGSTLRLPRSVEEVEALLGSSGLALAGRLHAAILALTQGCAVVGYSPTAKLFDYFATMALGDYAFRVDGEAALEECVRRQPWSCMRERQLECLRQSAAWGGRAAVRRNLIELSRIDVGAAMASRWT